jgi:hypothetical protein
MHNIDDSILRDGFQEVHTYTGHRREVKGCRLFSVGDESITQDILISWDNKCVCLWEKEVITHTIKFPKSQSGLISSIVFIPKINGNNNFITTLINYLLSTLNITINYIFNYSIFCHCFGYVI